MELFTLDSLLPSSSFPASRLIAHVNNIDLVEQPAALAEGL